MTLKLAASALVLAGIGAVGGAAIYASLSPSATTTVFAGSAAGSDLPPLTAAHRLSANEIYRLVSPGVVELKVVKYETNQDPYAGPIGLQKITGAGTGFVYDLHGDIVTNDHVVVGTQSITVRFSNNTTFKAHIVGEDADTDLAVIRVAAPSSLLHALTLGDSNTAQVGDQVVAIGTPFGHAESLSAGVVSALHVPMDAANSVPTDSIQTDTAINPGNSGGPLLNTLGQVIGITTSTESRGGYSDGVGFVIPSNTVRGVAVQIVAGHQVELGYFGASLANSTSPPGARLTTVLSAGPSAKAGMKPGDVVTSMDGVGIDSEQEMIALTTAHVPGDKVTITYSRAGTSHALTIVLGTRPA